jgi:tRNA (guanine10-N2)-dimethyltransferase
MELVAESLQGSAEKNKLFFVLSGEHASLPAAEVEAILDSAKLEANVLTESYRLLFLEAAPKALKVIAERSLMYNLCGIALGECGAEWGQITNLVKNLPLHDLTNDKSTFAVRVARLGGVNKTFRQEDLERDVGTLVKQQIPKLKADLSSPDVKFACVLFDNSFLFGISSSSKPSGLIAPRRPRKRPAFHPSTMPPKIARCMVNLSRANPGATFLDPFSGVGGISIEAAVIGCNVVAMDANPRMIRGARRNLRHFNLEALGYVHGDARHTPLRCLDAIATDPPYGRGSSTMGAKVANLCRDFLGGIGSSLKKGAHMCISAPQEIQVEDYAKEAGLRMTEKHLVRVHRSLTRQFVVLQNT